MWIICFTVFHVAISFNIYLQPGFNIDRAFLFNNLSATEWEKLLQ